jgi:hypothetical protein
MTDAKFICYTAPDEYEDLKNFFFDYNKINPDVLEIIPFDLKDNYFYDLFSKYKDFESAKKGDRCVEIQYMKYIWAEKEIDTCDHLYWIDAGLSHNGLIPTSYLPLLPQNPRGYYESTLFNNVFLKNLIDKTDSKFLLVGKENERNYWSYTVDPKHFIKYDRSIHIIGGLFGGKSSIWKDIVDKFKFYAEKVTEDEKRVYHEEDIMTLMFRNHNELFTTLDFDTWYHKDAPIPGLPENHFDVNKSFFRILEELQ